MPAEPGSFKVRLKVLSPVHIGSGQSLTRLDYYLDHDRYFHRIDLDALFADPDFAPQRDLFLEAAPGGQPIARLVPPELLLKHVSYRIRASKPAFDYARNRTIEVKAVIKSAGRVYIPGSSLKGAILSALVWKCLCQGWDNADAGKRAAARRDIGDLLGRGFVEYQDEEGDAKRRGLLDEVLRRVTEWRSDGPERDALIQWLQVSDSDMKAPGECLVLSLADAKGSRHDHRFLCETVQEGTEFTFRLKLPSRTTLTADTLLKTADEFYRKVAGADGIRGDRLTLPSAGLIRLGLGSGRFATSLLVLARGKGIAQYRLSPPRTRRRIDDVFPMGWAQLEVAS